MVKNEANGLKEIQENITQRIIEIEATFVSVVSNNKKSCQIVDELQTLFARDYQEFVRERRRWKSDFDNAAKRAQDNVSQIQTLLTQCLNQNDTNTKVCKMLLDAMMISQLCERQDVEDRKKIGVFGMRQDPRQVRPESAISNAKSEHSYQPADDQVLKVDRACIQCSGNRAQLIHQLKLCCLSYTAAPITYKDRQFQLSELLKTKANVISDCQRLIRQKIYQSRAYDGEDVYKNPDERSFIIEPLMMKTVSVNTNVEDTD